MSAGDLELRLFGDIVVMRNGERLALPQSKKTRALLAYLALKGAPERRERLCEIFWQVPDDPRGSLRWSLSKLRGLVNDESAVRIKADRERAAFDTSGVHVDYLDLQSNVGRLDDLDTTDLINLADRYSGELMAGLDLPNQPEFETFLLVHREKARVMRAVLLRAIVARLGEDHSARADRLYELVEIEPYDIDLHGALITALAQVGRNKEASRQVGLSKEALNGVDGVDLGLLDAALMAKPSATRVSSDQAAIINHTDRAAPEAPPGRQDIRFCKTADGVQIAYATVGSGPPLVKTANWLNHLEFDWESPVWRHFFRAFSADHTLIRYDERGNGLSDWRVKDFSFDSLVTDLEAVVDAAGIDRFPLLGISQGCAVAAEYAARYPEKVSKLVLFGGYARGWRIGRGEKVIADTEAMITLIKSGWGKDEPAFRQLFASLFMPDAPPENHQWFNELQRMTTSPENAAQLLEALGLVNVYDRLSLIKAPTLVAHARGDLRVPFDFGRELAACIPGARFVALETNNHLMPEDDPAWPRFYEAVRSFLDE